MLIDDLIPFLAALKARETTNRAVATQLGCSEEHVSRLLKQLQVVKDPPKHKVLAQQTAELTAARRAHRTKVANTMPPKAAARAANCCLRTIYRYRSKP